MDNRRRRGRADRIRVAGGVRYEAQLVNEQRIAPHQLLSHEVVGADNLTPELDLAS